MKSKSLIPLVVGAVVGVFAIKYTMDMVKNAKGAPSQEVTVVMARQDIPSTAELRPDMLVVAKTPSTPLLPSQVYTSVDQLAGRVALKSIPQGSPVLPSMIAPKGTLPGLLVRVKEGYRAVAVKIDESSGVGYLVQPNDWVDVLAVMETMRFGKKETVSRVILERVQVGAVGQALNEGPAEGSSKHAQTVTLIVEVDDVPKLHLAQTRGRITLAMRGNDDNKINYPDGDPYGDEFASKDPKPSAVSTAVAAWLSSGAGAAQATPKQTKPEVKPEPVVDETHTVTVINASATADSTVAAHQVTFSNEDSMQVVNVQNGPATPGSGPSRNPAPRTTVDSGAVGRPTVQHEKNVSNTPSEVSEE